MRTSVRRAIAGAPALLLAAVLAACGTPGGAAVGAGAEAEPALTVRGLLTAEGVECPAFRADDGTLYSLLGDLRGLRPGERAWIVGRPGQVSTCMQGIPLAVERVRPLP